MLLEALPEALDRDAVRSFCMDSATSARAATEAFLAVMVWGFGAVGYGPYRTRAMLNTPGAGTKLQTTATELAQGGAASGYELLAGGARITGLGPAFGTKYLYFCQPQTDRPMALILDRLVASWLRRELDLRINPVPWSLATYRLYLEIVHAWSAALECMPDEIELSIFKSMATEMGSQWGVSSPS